MASSCNRFRSAVKSMAKATPTFRSSPSSSPRFPAAASLPLPRFSLFNSRSPSVLGCVQSLLPLHSAVAAARMTSCLSVTSNRALSQELGLSVPR